MTVTQGKGRGFRSMTPEQRAAVSAKGGISAQKQDRGHQWRTPEEARMAGRKGGLARAQKARERKAAQS